MSVDADRLRDRTLELVEVESPTGDTAEVARLYAGWLEEIGMDVEVLDDVFPATPTVVGRLRGGEPGPTVVLYAHLDTVPIPHDPPRIEGDRVYGRGSADMKGAAAARSRRRASSPSRPFKGELVLVRSACTRRRAVAARTSRTCSTRPASPPTRRSSAS